jgi:hypothetical protein
MVLHLLFSQVLKDPNVSKTVLASRADALEMLGNIFQVRVSWFSEMLLCMHVLLIGLRSV